jgi:hypothetical protein
MSEPDEATASAMCAITDNPWTHCAASPTPGLRSDGPAAALPIAPLWHSISRMLRPRRGASAAGCAGAAAGTQSQEPLPSFETTPIFAAATHGERLVAQGAHEAEGVRREVGANQLPTSPACDVGGDHTAGRVKVADVPASAWCVCNSQSRKATR